MGRERKYNLLATCNSLIFHRRTFKTGRREVEEEIGWGGVGWGSGGLGGG